MQQEGATHSLSALLPGQAIETPAGQGVAMMTIIQLTLESMQHVVDLGKARLLQWQAQLRGSEQQLRHSVNPRLWLEVLLLGLLAEPVAAAQPIAAAAPAAAPPAAAGCPAGCRRAGRSGRRGA